MKKICFILAVLFLMVNISVKADSVTLSVDCNKLNLKRGEEATCELGASISSTLNIDNLNLDLEYGNGLTITYQKNEIFDGTLTNGRLSLVSEGLQTGNFKLGTIKILIANDCPYGETSVNFKNVQFSNTNNITEIYNSENVSKTINVISDNNDLKMITINGTDLIGFKSDNLNYRFETLSSKITIGATAVDGDLTKIEGLGDKTINYGENEVKIKVISQAGSEKYYNLVVVREDNRSTVNTLKTLSIEGINFKFDSNRTDYKIDVQSDISKVKITSTLTDNKSSYVKDFGNREVNLAYGENVVLIKVQSEKGDIRTYTLKLNRIDDRSDVAKLVSLSINDIKVDVKDGIYEYNVVLRHKNNKTNVKALANTGATIKYEDINLEVGNNELIIKVISEKETEEEYKINIKRLTLEESRVAIENILVEGYELNFSKEVKEYKLKIDQDVSSLKISVLPDAEEVAYSVLGNSNLKNNSVVTINVKDDLGTYVYTINIEKEVGPELILGFLTIEQLAYIILSIGILSFICSLIYIFKVNKAIRN